MSYQTKSPCGAAISVVTASILIAVLAMAGSLLVDQQPSSGHVAANTVHSQHVA